MSFDSHDSLQDRWIRVDLGALAQNVKILKALFGADGPRFMAVVKANGYGHGAAGIAKTLRDAGADWFGVTTLGEALELVRAGIDSRQTPILVFAPPTDPEQVRVALAYSLHMTVCDTGHLELISAAAGDRYGEARLHLKIDTGMGRFGLDPDSALVVARQRDTWAGVYTHFANAGAAGLTATIRQLHSFRVFCAHCGRENIDVGVRHCANSASALRAPDTRLDMVRIGTALYGQMPSEHVHAPEGLRQDTFVARAKVVFVRDLKPGSPIGYGSEMVTKSARRVAVVPIGFADGFETAPASLFRGWRGACRIVAQGRSGHGPHITVRGRRAPVLGRVAMQTVVIDVTGFDPPVQCGETADIPMRRLGAGALLPRRYE